MKDLISVIVPIYNVEKYLVQCVESIINQTYSGLEIILVDDGSIDRSGIICDNLAKKDDRIRVVHKQNGGLSDARNAGLEVATGKYVSFIDSDDFIDKTYYETLINLMTQYDADIVQCSFKKVFEEQINENIIPPEGNDDSVYVFNNVEALNNLYNEHYVQTVIACNKLFKTELFESIRFPKGKLHEDELTTYKLLFTSNKLVMTLKPLYNYLQRAGSITKANFNPKRMDTLEAYSSQIAFYNEKGLFELKNKAIIVLESLVRRYMCSVLNSKLSNKEELFAFLSRYYKDHFTLFKSVFSAGSIKHVIVYVYRYSPKMLLKALCTLLIKRANVVSN